MKKLLAIILAILMIVTTVPMVALPASAALTPTATGGCNGNHSGYTQIQLNGGTTHRITKAGKYYLNSSIYESTYSPALTIECSGTVTICLNGNDICHTGYGSRVVYLSPNGGELTVNLCDCKGTGEIYHEDGNTGIDFAPPGVITLNMYGGTIRDCDSGLSTWSNSTVNMYGGTIKNCSYYGIFQDSNNGKVNIYGGSIINNNEGIRVCSADSVTLTGSPIISGNTNGDLYYRRPNSAVVAKDLSVSSPITIGQDSSASGDYAVVKVDSADMLGSFKYINNTKQLFYNNNQIFVHGDSHSFKDATCAAPKTCTICGATEGVADNTAHTWGEGVLTRPTKTVEGYYTYTCSACGATKTEAVERAANYAEYTKALNDLRAYLDSDKLTDDAKASVAEWLELYDSDAAYKFIAGEEETVNLYIEAALYYAAEIEAAIQDCLAGNHSGNGEYCDICGAALHTCDFTGEWKYDSEKHWKECTCGETDKEAVHTLTEGKCECGYECPHEETYETVTQLEHFSVQNSDGTWTKATISVVCRECESVIEYKDADRADYTEFDKYMARACELLETGNLTENAYIQYSKPVNNIKNSVPIMGSPFQSTPDTYVESLEHIIGEIEAGIADGTMIKADFTYMTALFDEVNAVINGDASLIIPSEVGKYWGPYYYYSSQLNNANHSQASYDENMTNNNFENDLAALAAGLKDGTMLKADYTAIDEAIAEIEEKLRDVELTDEAMATLKDIKAQLAGMKNDPLTSKADLAVLENALDEYETELDAGIEDGSAVKVDGFAIIREHSIHRITELNEKYGRTAYNDVVDAAADILNKDSAAIEAEAKALTGSVKENEEKIAELISRLDASFFMIENCLMGVHNGLEFKVTEEAECEKDAIESADCAFCGATVSRVAGGSALGHSFTKYETVEEAKCGVAGKEQAYCDNGCGATEVRVTDALKHIPLDAVKENEVAPKCEKEGSYDLVVYCELCGGELSRETFAVDALEHVFVDYVYNNDATCEADGTKTAICVRGCEGTDTVVVEGTKLDHTDADGDIICDSCETEIKEVCPDCGAVGHEGPYGEYICMLRMLIKLVAVLIKTLRTMAVVA